MPFLVVVQHCEAINWEPNNNNDGKHGFCLSKSCSQNFFPHFAWKKVLHSICSHCCLVLFYVDKKSNNRGEKWVQRKNPYEVWIFPLRIGFSPRKPVFEPSVLLVTDKSYWLWKSATKVWKTKQIIAANFNILINLLKSAGYRHGGYLLLLMSCL